MRVLETLSLPKSSVSVSASLFTNTKQRQHSRQVPHLTQFRISSSSPAWCTGRVQYISINWWAEISDVL